MNFPCPIKEPCLDDANPVQNLSSEAPDAFIFYGYGSGPGSISGSPNGPAPPPGRNWLDSCNTANGPIVCTSTISQEDANLCVTRLGLQCTPPDGSPTPPGSPTDPSGSPMFRSGPAQCSTFCDDGSPFTFFVPAGAFIAASQLLADREAFSYACRQAQLNRVCFSALSPTECCFGQPYSGHITASGKAPLTFSISSGSLPPGLHLTSSGKTATISGTPTGTGLFSFSVKVVDGNGNFMIKAFTLGVIGFTNVAPPVFTLGTPYSFQFTAAGGSAPLTFAIVVGVLPSGLSMTSSGLVSGTPTDNVSQTFSLTVTDAGGFSCTKQYTITSSGIKTGFQVCHWTDQILPLMTDFGFCSASAFPAWDGIFTNKIASGFPPTGDYWYFLGQSIKGSKASADDMPDYPNPGWQDIDTYTQIFYDTSTGTWALLLQCDIEQWWVGEVVTGNPNDPSGTYTQIGGESAGPNQITVAATPATCCKDAGDPVPVNFNAASPAQVRVKNFAAFTAAVTGAACGTCAAASGQPAWDGTFPLKCSTGPANLSYLNAGGNCIETTPVTQISWAGFAIQRGAFTVNHHLIQLTFHSGDRWEIEIFCDSVGFPAIWTGSKLVGDTPVGTYMRGGTGNTGCATTPACIEIEAF
jgi:hypothetical protein